MVRRFFFDPDERRDNRVYLKKEEAKHIRSVLRLKTGEKVELIDGASVIYSAELVVEEKSVYADITGSRQEAETAGPELWLAQAVLKGSKSDELLSKCTELGVDVFAPFQSARCQGRLNSMKQEKKLGRWKRIVEASCKQCMRVSKMNVNSIIDYHDLVIGLGEPQAGELRLFFWEEEIDCMLHDVDFSDELTSIKVLLGPEGGFSAEEADLAAQYGFISVSLGKRILRAETATVAAVAVIQHLAGRFG